MASINTHIEPKVRAAALKSAQECGIIFIDEIDKLIKAHVSSDASDEGVQRDLLPLLEGTKIRVKVGKTGNEIEVDTSNILFIVSGAFIKNQPTELLSEFLVY